MGKFSEAAARHAINDTQMIAAVAPPVQEKGTFAKAAEQVMEIMPTAQEVGAELGNRVQEAQGFAAKFGADVWAQAKASFTQGQSEVANALFNGHGYHPESAQTEPEKDQQREQERGMER